MGVIATLAREITRGAVLGYFEALRISKMAQEEKPNADDHRRARAFRSAVKRLPESSGHTIANRAPSGSGGSASNYLGADG